ncbi:MAG: ABC transporter ATP-binding protein [Myxococcales bacterium]|nr:ABC transporter ATP-binding protein [Myxococcales bacterium]
MTAHIEIRGLDYSYPDGSRALSGINLRIEKGEKVALIGSNGAGKSTLLLHLNGTLRGSGRISIDGVTIEDSSIREIRKKVGLIFQDPNDQLFCPTVEEDVAFGPMHFSIPKNELSELVISSLDEVGMRGLAKRPSHHLSLGERRRVSIAAVLSMKPEILALDEPASALDPKRKRWLIDFLRSSTLTTLLATHDLMMAFELCDRTIILREGKITFDGRTKEIASNADLLLQNDLEIPVMPAVLGGKRVLHHDGR